MWHPTAIHRNGNLVQPWILTVQTTAINQTFGLTLGGATVAVKIIWGDGSFNDYVTTGGKSHTFAAAGTYQVLVSGRVTNPLGSITITTGGTRLLSTSAYQGIEGGRPAGTFMACSNAAFTSLPNGLFKNYPDFSLFSYSGALLGCNKLVLLPADLFSYHAGSSFTLFSNCFWLDAALTSIPPTLFDRFRISSYPGWLVLNGCFSACAALTGPAPELWDPAQFNTGGTNHADCFKGCTGLSNWADIPNDWKGL